MFHSSRTALAAAAAAAAMALAAGQAQATNHVLTLTGDVSTLSTNSFSFGGRDYQSGFVELSGFTPFTLEDGDTVEFSVHFTNGPFVVPTASEMFFGMNFADILGGAEPSDATSTGNYNFDGGPNQGSGCGNCTDLITFFSNTPVSITDLTGTGGFTLPSGPYAINFISASYQVSDLSSGAVPEPAAWALMIGGFGLAGGMLRRRRAVAA